MSSNIQFQRIVEALRDVPKKKKVEFLLDVIKDIFPEESDPQIDALELNLSRTHYNILRRLLRWEGQVTPKEAVYAAICAGRPKPDWPAEKTLDVHIHNLRNKLSGTDWSIQTIQGRGYILRVDDTKFPSLGKADVGAVTDTPTYLPELDPGA